MNKSILINATFKLNNGEKVILVFNRYSTIDRIKKDFLDEIFFRYDDFCEFRIKLLYNGHEIHSSIASSIGYIFQSDNNPEINVNDPNNLIGHKVQVTFKTNHGYKEKNNLFWWKNNWKSYKTLFI